MAQQSILGGVQIGQQQQAGQRIVIAGAEKVGKTTLACGAPGALLVPMEMGYGAMNVAHTQLLDNWESVEQLCLELIAGAKSGRVARGSSVVWDSGTALERIIHDKCLRMDGTYRAGNATGLNMETALGGYGKAYKVANDLFGTWTRYMDDLAKYGGVNCIVTCHVFAAKMLDPAHGEYNSWDLQLHSPKDQKTYGKREFITQWADMIGFLHEPLFVQKAEQGAQMNKAVNSGQGRQMGVERTPGWVAGNRYGLTGLVPIPLQHGWNFLADAIYKASANTGVAIDLYNRSV